MRKLTYIAAIVVVSAMMAQAAMTTNRKSELSANLSIFNSVVKELQTNYVDTIDIEKAVNTAIDAMLSTLDPYTEYIPRKEQEDFRTLNAGEYAGIGSYIMSRNGNVYISGPYEGSPAVRAGLRPGDMILTIDGDTMLNQPSDKVSERLKGAKGTSVTVTVKRPYVTDSILTVNIVREKILIPAVPYFGVIGDDLGYIQLSQYSERSADEVKAALESLLSEHRVKGIVLDLRDNGGGFVESAVSILSYFLPKGTEVLRTGGREVMNERVYKTTQKPIAPNIPLAVLIDGGTASTAEITAGALQDLDRAVIIGSRSYGKGLVQTTRSLPYDGLLKVTVSKYYIPSGRLIQAIDYAHRNADGSASRIPDSLTTEYTTKAGRIVRDGGGITPDVSVTYPDVSRITYNVVADNWAFDYANKYRATHPSLPAPEQFTITDSIYADFKAFIDPAKFNKDKVCITILDRLEVLKGIDLNIAKGEIMSIVGPSGAGKTTLLQIMGSLDRPDSGSVTIDGESLFSMSGKRLAQYRNQNIGFIFQFHQLLPEFTMEENVAMPALIGGASRKDAFARARRLIDYLGLTDRASHRPAELSGGERQRAAVARSLVNNPKIIFADEPSGSLDTHNRDELHRLFFDLRRDMGQTFVIVTHDQSLARMADRMVQMCDGIITDITTNTDNQSQS